MRAEAENGYVSGFEIYIHEEESRFGGEKSWGYSSENTHRHLYFDNSFSIVDFLLDLFCVGLYGCGTLHSNRRGFPAVLKPHVKKGFRDRG